MKYNKLSLLLIAICICACTAYTDHDLPDSVTELMANVPDIVFDDGTKSAVTTSGAFSWVANDKLGFWPDASDVTFGAPTQAIFYVESSSNGNSCSRFKANGWGLLSGKRYYSYFPYDENSTASAVSVSYRNQNQTANDNANHLGNYEYLHSSVVAGPDITLNYNHLGCFAKIILSFNSEFSSTIFTDVSLSAGSAVFVESARYNPCSTSVTLTDKVMKNSMTLTLDSGNGFRCNNSNQLVLYAMMSPSQWSGIPVAVTVHSADQREFTGTFTPTRNQEAGKGYVYSANMDCTGGYYDLSRQETANCYIISEAGDYMFKATMGNSANAVEAASVRVLWESVGTSSATAAGTLIKAVSCNNGYIKFSTNRNFVEGNALIAAYNSSGAIVWSWHIWCTDVPADEEYFFDAGTLMDRNLGGLDKVGDLSTGLFYQWGRKDPFPGNASIFGVLMAKTSLGDFPAPVASSATNGTVAWATAHPTTFIKGTNQLDWLWSLDTVDRTWYDPSGKKTVYDPCPPGYKVPDGSRTANTSAGRGFWGKAFGINNVVWATNYVCSTPAGGLYFINSTLLVPITGNWAYYPAAGCMNDGGGWYEYAGDHAFEWTNSPGGTDSTYSNWNTQYSSALDINMSTGNGTVTVNWNSGRASGKNVRCQLMGQNISTSSLANEAFSTENSTW